MIKGAAGHYHIVLVVILHNIATLSSRSPVGGSAIQHRRLRNYFQLSKVRYIFKIAYHSIPLHVVSTFLLDWYLFKFNPPGIMVLSSEDIQIASKMAIMRERDGKHSGARTALHRRLCKVAPTIKAYLQR
jgi:hypothetical protein